MKFLIILSLLMNIAFAGINRDDLSSTDYFRLFDYHEHDKIDEIFEFEKKLINQANLVENFLISNPDYRPTSKKHSTRLQLAMNLVYAAMMIMNNNNGAIEGHIKLGRKEIIARYTMSARFMKLATETAPEDDRIPSWYYANLLRKQKYEEGRVDEKTLDMITAAALRSPVFHLFNALTMSSDYDFGQEREEKLTAKAKFMGSKESPCRTKDKTDPESKKCDISKKTPFAIQGVTTYIGDVYLKEAVRLHATDPEKSKASAQGALSQYTAVKFVNGFLSALQFRVTKKRRWQSINLIPKRVEIAQGLVNGEDRSGDFFKTRNYLDIYTCVSCHQSGKGKDELSVHLP